MKTDQIFAQLEELSRRQYPESETAQLRFFVELLKQAMREREYSAEQARAMILDNKQPKQE
jgi:hypothetical protein